MNELFAVLDEDQRGKLREEPQPGWTRPMLATLTDEPFSDPGWIFERKLDGVRCLAFRKGASVRLMSRNEKRMNASYPELAEALEAQAVDDFIVDGEIVAFEGRVTSFSRLQGRMQLQDPKKARRSGIAVHLYLFDVLHLDGHDTTRVALRGRKELLRRALDFERPLHFSAHRNEHGERYLEDACRRGWEGLIAKRADGAYVHGRSRDWLKLKCTARQELVIVGFTDPKGARSDFGALIVGVYGEDGLRSCGKVGTGFDQQALHSLGRKLRSLERKSSPLNGANAEDDSDGDVHWVRPELVCEVGFTEWTREGRLRHPRFLGLRADKDPREVVRESPGARG